MQHLWGSISSSVKWTKQIWPHSTAVKVKWNHGYKCYPWMAYSTCSMNDTYNFYAYDCDHHSRKWEQSQQKYKFEKALSKILPMGLAKGAWK